MTSTYTWKTIQGVQTQELPTLLDDTSGDIVTTVVTIVGYNRMIGLSVNETANVTASDIVSREGVIQFLDKVLLPGSTFPDGCTVEQLKEVLYLYVRA